MSLRRLAASRLRSGECPMGAASRTPDVAAKLHPFRVKGWLKVYFPIGPLIRFRRCRSMPLASFPGDSFALKSKVRRVYAVLLATCGFDSANVCRFVLIHIIWEFELDSMIHFVCVVIKGAFVNCWNRLVYNERLMFEFILLIVVEICICMSGLFFRFYCIQSSYYFLFFWSLYIFVLLKRASQAITKYTMTNQI